MPTMPFFAVGVKHGNACGVGVGNTPADAIMSMVGGDPRAQFGGLVMVNFDLSSVLVELMLTHGRPVGSRLLLDGVVCPSIHEDALDLLRRKGDKCRLIVNPALGEVLSLDQTSRIRPVRGGFLRQPNYTFVLDLKNVEDADQLTDAQRKDMVTAWAICCTSNSNTITLVKDGQLIGNGVGQQDRVGAAELAIKRATDAGHDVNGAIACSDSFFPFSDGPMVLAQAGVQIILATSGSIRDNEVKQACSKRGVSLYLIPDTLGRGFFGH